MSASEMQGQYSASLEPSASTGLLESLIERGRLSTVQAPAPFFKGTVFGLDETPNIVTIGLSHLRDGKRVVRWAE